MTSPAITLDQSQGLAPAVQNVETKGSLEGRSVVPCPSKRCLTDVQIKKIALVALAVFTTAAFAAMGAAFVFGGLTVGVALGCITVASFGMAGGSVGVALFSIFWPHADYQTEKGAATIRNDLKTKGLRSLAADYTFSDLAKYGYISKENAQKMQSLSDRPARYTCYFRDHSGERTYSYESDHVPNDCHSYVYDTPNNEFNILRKQPGFLL